MAINANYMTLNPLYLINHSYPPSTSYIIDGNLTLLNAVSNYGIGMTHGFYSGKWYWEILLADKGQFVMGFITVDTFNGQQSQPHNKTGSYLVYTDTSNNGQKIEETSFISLSNFNAGDGDIIGFALDRDNRKLWVSLNGTFINSGDPAGGSNPVFDSGDITATTGEFRPIIGTYGGQNVKMTLNAGQDSSFVGQKTSGSNNATDGNGFGDFYYTPPTGYLSACSNNVPTSDDIDPGGDNGADENPTKQFNVITYTGNRTSGSTTNNITGVGFQPDLVWLKILNNTYDHRLVDSSRGAGKHLRSNKTNAESTEATGLTSFDSDGFTVSGDNNYNSNGDPFVAFCWRANGGTTASNSDGSITSTVQANTAAGFSIIEYTGDENAGTIGHGLSAKPDLIFFKSLGTTDDWGVYHSYIGATNALTGLNSSAGLYNYTIFNNTEPTTSVITLGAAGSVGRFRNNKSSTNYVAYCWHSVEGYSKFGSFEGNANADGPFIYTGFRPRLLFIKNIDSSSAWGVYDGERPGFNDCDLGAWDENTGYNNNIGTYPCDILSNGFKLKTSNATVNSSHTWVYGAWGDVPFKYNNTF